mmetsp:Transcript_21378/g.59253  ORF Transcript_21378/g.59253 Transcript_21378/m.59253 type:complete len:93 (-) Transcript_21378:308-586(-)
MLRHETDRKAPSHRDQSSTSQVPQAPSHKDHGSTTHSPQGPTTQGSKQHHTRTNTSQQHSGTTGPHHSGTVVTAVPHRDHGSTTHACKSTML